VTLAAMTLADIADVSITAWAFVAGVFGLVFGSFVTAFPYRIPGGESVAEGRSKCAACGTALTARDLVPVLSWVLSRGQCRTCGVSVSWRYPAIEIITAVVFVSAVWHEQRLVPLGLLLAAALTMIALAVIDLEHRRMPLPMLALLAVLWVAWRWSADATIGQPMFTDSLMVALIMMVTGLVIASATRAWRGTPLIGAADTYSLAIGALALPWLPFLLFVWLAGALALVQGLIWRLATRQPQFPFGPAVFMALWLAVLFQGAFISFVS